MKFKAVNILDPNDEFELEANNYKEAKEELELAPNYKLEVDDYEDHLIPKLITSRTKSGSAVLILFDIHTQMLINELHEELVGLFLVSPIYFVRSKFSELDIRIVDKEKEEEVDMFLKGTVGMGLTEINDWDICFCESDEVQNFIRINGLYDRREGSLPYVWLDHFADSVRVVVGEDPVSTHFDRRTVLDTTD